MVGPIGETAAGVACKYPGDNDALTAGMLAASIVDGIYRGAFVGDCTSVVIAAPQNPPGNRTFGMLDCWIPRVPKSIDTPTPVRSKSMAFVDTSNSEGFHVQSGILCAQGTLMTTGRQDQRPDRHVGRILIHIVTKICKVWLYELYLWCVGSGMCIGVGDRV